MNTGLTRKDMKRGPRFLGKAHWYFLLVYFIIVVGGMELWNR